LLKEMDKSRRTEQGSDGRLFQAEGPTIFWKSDLSFS